MTANTADGDRPRDSDIDVPTLLGDDHEAYERALAEGTGPVAVTGDPFAGRGTVLDHAARRLDATRVELDPGDGIDRIRMAMGDGPVVVYGCQHLYERRVGGFDDLSAFLDELAGADVPVVAGWNRYAWAYLAAVRGLDREFSVTVGIAPVPADRIAELVLERYDEMPRFVADDPDRGGLVVTDRYELGWRGRTVSVPVPKASPVAIRALFADGDLDPEDVVFGRLAAAANGNVGVAVAIWNLRRGAELRPSNVAAPTSDLDLRREEAFCLRIVLASERVEREQLAAILDGSLDRILGRLSRDGLVAVEDGTVSLVPAAVPTAADATDRGRIL